MQSMKRTLVAALYTSALLAAVGVAAQEGQTSNTTGDMVCVPVFVNVDATH